MPKRGRRRKKNRTHAANPEEAGAAGGATALVDPNGDRKIPKSLVTRKGSTAAEVGELVTDMRRLMQPYTALHFQDDPKDRKLTLQQYSTHLALPMGISHILQFSQKEDRCNLRLARLPEGPVLTFRVHQFSLSRHIVRLQKRPVAWTGSMNSCPPIVVTNNFGDHTAPPHVKLMRITFQNLFPQINVSTVKLKDCRRVVLFNLIDEPDPDDESQTRQIVHVRHYAIRATPVGVHRRIRRIIHNNNNKALPNLHQCNDIADYLTGQSHVMSDVPSDSEPEDGDEQVVQLSDQYVGKGNSKNQTSALKLVELGPRLSWQLLKVEKGLDAAHSPCLYNARVTKTPEEAAALQASKQSEKELKQLRRATQEANVERKRRAAKEKREQKRQRRQQHEEGRAGSKLLEGHRIEGVSSSSEDDEDSSSSSSDEE